MDALLLFRVGEEALEVLDVLGRMADSWASSWRSASSSARSAAWRASRSGTTLETSTSAMVARSCGAPCRVSASLREGEGEASAQGDTPPASHGGSAP